jgi:hypothetical protein
MPLVLHWGGPRQGDVEDAAELLASSVLVYDGPRWFGVYERFRPVQLQDTAQGPPRCGSSGNSRCVAGAAAEPG